MPVKSLDPEGDDVVAFLLTLSSADAIYLVYRLLLDGALTRTTAQQYLSERDEHSRNLTRLARRVERARKRRRETKPRRLSDEVRQRRRLQGRFIGLLRGVPASERDVYRRLYSAQSPEAAVQALEERKRQAAEAAATRERSGTGVRDE